MAGQDIAVQIVNLAFDHTAGVMQNMQKGGVLAVQIRKKMLCALRQAQNSAQMSNLGGCFLNRSELLTQKL